jgi:16S rRNA (cytosine967-C5)-methyltransferase
MRFQSYFNTAIKIIQLYDGAIPLAHFLKKYFSENKKHGSKDRKFITQACYNFYRLGFALKNISIEERLQIAIFLCNANAGEWKILYDDEWIQRWDNKLKKRIYFIQSAYNFSVGDIFPFADEVSSDLNKDDFNLSHFIQPDVFLRIRNNQHEKVFSVLHHHHIVFEKINEDCIAVENATKIDSIIEIDKEAVIQDYSSQRIKEFLEIIKSEIGNHKSQIDVWDCCAGSGGKSILAHDVLQNINLIATDIRPSIIHNLKERFNKAGIKNYKAFVADFSNPKLEIRNLEFDAIICDAPCTGSGTWSRTPEQLYFFQPEKIKQYQTLQNKIVANAISYLKRQSYFLYITCSVFKAENEDVIKFIQNNFQLTLIKRELLKGYSKKADTMFAALFKKIV